MAEMMTKDTNVTKAILTPFQTVVQQATKDYRLYVMIQLREIEQRLRHNIINPKSINNVQVSQYAHSVFTMDAELIPFLIEGVYRLIYLIAQNNNAVSALYELIYTSEYGKKFNLHYSKQISYIFTQDHKRIDKALSLKESNNLSSEEIRLIYKCTLIILNCLFTKGLQLLFYTSQTNNDIEQKIRNNTNQILVNLFDMKTPFFDSLCTWHEQCIKIGRYKFPQSLQLYYPKPFSDSTQQKIDTLFSRK